MAEVYPEPQLLPVASSTLLRCDSEWVAVEVKDHHRRLVASRPVPQGTRLFRIEGNEVGQPTKYSVQVGPDLHIDQDCAKDEFDVVRGYFWRYLDHACEPTVMIRERDVIAVRDIEAGEAVTFHYCTTEYDMATPFPCHCGATRCLGTIRGAKHLKAADRKRLLKWMAEWVR